MRKHLFFLPLFFFSLCSCLEEKRNLLAEVKAVPLKGDIITTELMAYHTMQSACIQSHLFFFTPSDNEVCLVVDPETGTETGVFGSIGNGPGELGLFSVFAGRSERGDTVYMFDRKHVVNAYELNIEDHRIKYSFIQSKAMERARSTDLFKTTLIGLQRLHNGYYVGLNIVNEKYLFSLFDQELRLVKEFGDFPIKDTPPGFFFLVPFEGVLAVYHNNIYFAVKKFGYMTNYEISASGDVRKKWDFFYSEPSYDIRNGEIRFKGKSNLHGFSDIAIGRKYIYALYSGIPSGAMFTKRSVYAIEPKSLVLLEHDGTVVKKYALRNPSNTLCLSEDEKYLYIKTNHPDIAIERFKVSGLNP